MHSEGIHVTSVAWSMVGAQMDPGGCSVHIFCEAAQYKL